MPTLGDAFQRPSRQQDVGQEGASEGTARDSNDRMRRVASQTPRRVEFTDDIDYDDPYFAGNEVSEFGVLPPAPREARGRRRAIAAERRSTPTRPAPAQQIGGLIAAAGPQTRLIAGTGGFALISLVFMVATVAGRMNSMPDWLPIHLNAEGQPDLWGSSATMWRLPFMTLMLTAMSGAVAWYLWKREPFAARFTLASTTLIHALSWIALINLVW